VLAATGEIGAATGIEFLGGGRMLAAAEPERRGGGSAAVVDPD
jgi:gamma-glutamyltranspeptidase / glutathione hydrolase